MADVKFKIEKHIGAISDKNDKGWQKELNLVSWNDRPAKYDIRDWNDDHTKMGKGCTLTADELTELMELAQTVVG